LVQEFKTFFGIILLSILPRGATLFAIPPPPPHHPTYTLPANDTFLYLEFGSADKNVNVYSNMAAPN
jgi:hypothetical protein